MPITFRPAYHDKGTYTKTFGRMADTDVSWTSAGRGIVDVNSNASPLPGRQSGAYARGWLVIPIDPEPGKMMHIHTEPYCYMDYAITSHRTYAHTKGMIGMRVDEFDGNGRLVASPVNWWRTLWHVRTTPVRGVPIGPHSPAGARSHSWWQANTVPLHDSLAIREGHFYVLNLLGAVSSSGTGLVRSFFAHFTGGHASSWARSRLHCAVSEVVVWST